MGHGIARLSPNYCCDQLRFRNLGFTEAQVWDKYVLQQRDQQYLIENDGKPHASVSGQMNTMLSSLGLAEEYCGDILNPGLLSLAICT